MSAIVLDCSAAVSLVLPDKRSAAVQEFLSAEEGREPAIHVPSLWWYEVTNVLVTAGRRERIALGVAREALSALARVPTTTEANTGLSESVHLFHLCVQFGLTTYDAAYIGLAERTGGTLVTLDKPLQAAAESLGISCGP
jgi:predicted nucleic acid-binding protein